MYKYTKSNAIYASRIINEPNTSSDHLEIALKLLEVGLYSAQAHNDLEKLSSRSDCNLTSQLMFRSLARLVYHVELLTTQLSSCSTCYLDQFTKDELICIVLKLFAFQILFILSLIKWLKIYKLMSLFTFETGLLYIYIYIYLFNSLINLFLLNTKSLK